MTKTKKALNFDLDVNQLKKYYTNKHYTQAYADIRNFLEKAGFEHRQGSGYISIQAITLTEVSKITKEMGKKFTWLSYCAKEFDVTSVGKTHSLLNKFTKDIVPEKEEPLSEELNNDIDLDIADEYDYDYEIEM